MLLTFARSWNEIQALSNIPVLHFFPGKYLGFFVGYREGEIQAHLYKRPGLTVLVEHLTMREV